MSKTPQTVIKNRAYKRALARMRELHPDEFAKLFAEEQDLARIEYYTTGGVPLPHSSAKPWTGICAPCRNHQHKKCADRSRCECRRGICLALSAEVVSLP